MISYLAIFSTHFRLYLQYRAAAFAGFATQLFWGLIRVMIFAAFYQATTAPQPMTYDEVVSYIWLGQAMFALIPWNVNRDLQQLIRTGGVAYELLRPLDLYWFWFCRVLAGRTAPTLLRAAPIFIIASLFLGLQPPASWQSAFAWLLLTLTAVFLSCAITTVTTISLLWTLSGEGINQIVMTAVMLFCGLIVPLPLFPDWVQPIINLLPFRGLADIPFRLYLGHIPPNQVVSLFLQQAGWIAGLIFFGRFLLSRALKVMVIQGG